ncbi:Ku protein [Candidatus Parcubacteria bacterium]|nr:Ku protein [Candidatus Parcubacteria bacterium]
MRAIWSGAISFGLVNIPVKLYSATQERVLKFNLLHKKDLSPIHNVRVCEADGREVPYEDLVRGFEYQKGDYVVLSEEDFKKANVRKTKTIDILDFADEEDIDTIFFDTPYYLEPEKKAEKPYALLREALKKSGRVGVAQFVLRTKEHLAVLRPYGNVIVLNQLRFHHEIRPTKELELPDKEIVKAKEVEMALRLIDELTGDFDPASYHDTYSEELMNIIEARAKGKRPKAKGKAPRATRTPDLMATLRQSLQRTRQR